MRALKISVVAMGVLIIVGFAVMAAELIRRSLDGGGSGDATVAPLNPAALGLRSGERVVALAAGGERLIVVVEDADGVQRILDVAIDGLR
ncbi:MAG: hypothetical protein RLO50_04690 [Azospirillaceae bacterium]